MVWGGIEPPNLINLELTVCICKLSLHNTDKLFIFYCWGFINLTNNKYHWKLVSSFFVSFPYPIKRCEGILLKQKPPPSSLILWASLYVPIGLHKSKSVCDSNITSGLVIEIMNTYEKFTISSINLLNGIKYMPRHKGPYVS